MAEGWFYFMGGLKMKTKGHRVELIAWKEAPNLKRIKIKKKEEAISREDPIACKIKANSNQRGYKAKTQTTKESSVLLYSEGWV